MRNINLAPRWYYGWTVVSIVFLVLLVSAAISSIPSVLMLQFEENSAGAAPPYPARCPSASFVRINGSFLRSSDGPLRHPPHHATDAELANSEPCADVFYDRALAVHRAVGIVMGLATGALANVLGVTVAGRWFVKHRGSLSAFLQPARRRASCFFCHFWLRSRSDWAGGSPFIRPLRYCSC